MEPGLLDRRVSHCLGLECIGLLFTFGCLTVGVGLSNTRSAGDRSRMGHRQVLDVSGGVVDLLDLQRVDDQSELGHLRARRLACAPRQLLTVANHVLHRHAADDGPEMTGEHIVDPLIHFVLLVEEPSGSIGDARRIVADLEDHRSTHVDGDALVSHAVNLEIGSMEVERQTTHGLDAGNDESSLAGHDSEAHFIAGGILGDAFLTQARDDQSLVRLGHSPHRLEEQHGQQNCSDHDRRRNDDHGIDCQVHGVSFDCRTADRVRRSWGRRPPRESARFTFAAYARLRRGGRASSASGERVQQGVEAPGHGVRWSTQRSSFRNGIHRAVWGECHHRETPRAGENPKVATERDQRLGHRTEIGGRLHEPDEVRSEQRHLGDHAPIHIDRVAMTTRVNEHRDFGRRRDLDEEVDQPSTATAAS